MCRCRCECGPGSVYLPKLWCGELTAARHCCVQARLRHARCAWRAAGFAADGTPSAIPQPTLGAIQLFYTGKAALRRLIEIMGDQAVLNARPGDAQALKACIAAHAAGVALEVRAAGPQNLFGTPAVTLSVGGGGLISEPNAAAAFLAGETR